MKPHEHLIVTADERKATLFACTTVPGGRWHVASLRSIENKWEDYHEKHRPSALGRGPSASAAQHFASVKHEPEEEHRRFAREVGAWLKSEASRASAPHLSVFAAPRFLGLLRAELAGVRGRPEVELHEGELTRLQPHELATHPAIVRALEPRTAST
jgi:protein required for attachment to host cells